MLKHIFLFTCCLSSLIALSQPGKRYEVADGDEHVKHQNYLMALPVYLQLLKSDPTNAELQYKIADCYLKTNINKTEAIKYLEFYSKNSKADKEVWFKLGRAYRLANKIDEAMEAFTKYKEQDPKKIKIAEREIEICQNAKTLMLSPVNVSFTNLGKDINSEFADYYPWITEAENFLAFTSRRRNNLSQKLEMDGYYASDIYYSKVENGKWQKVENMGPKINSSLDEQVVGMKPDGSELLIYIDHIDTYGDIYSSVKKNGSYSKYIPFNSVINKKKEYAASINDKGNVLFIVRAENTGEQTDIYMCRKVPNGGWSEPLMLGPEINTPYNEQLPYLAPDGVTLYFSSEGHNTMGGFDLFKSTWNPEKNTWTPAKNLGYPVNTTDDDKSISLTSDRRVGYISALRPGGYGDLDIYRVKFNNIDQKLTMFVGSLILGDSLYHPKEYIATILAVNQATHEEYSFAPNPASGRFVMALPAGTFSVSITSDGFKELKDLITVSDLGLSLSEEIKNYKLLK